MRLAALLKVEIWHADRVPQLVSDRCRVEEDGELKTVWLRDQLGHLVSQLAADAPVAGRFLPALEPSLLKFTFLEAMAALKIESFLLQKMSDYHKHLKAHLHYDENTVFSQ